MGFLLQNLRNLRSECGDYSHSYSKRQVSSKSSPDRYYSLSNDHCEMARTLEVERQKLLDSLGDLTVSFYFRGILRKKYMEKPKDFTKILSPKEITFLGETFDQIRKMRELLSQPRKEWNGLNYYQHYEKCREVDLAYNPEISQNKDNMDFNVTSGTTREKDTDLVSVMLNSNLKPNIEAFDSNNLVIVVN